MKMGHGLMHLCLFECVSFTCTERKADVVSSRKGEMQIVNEVALAPEAAFHFHQRSEHALRAGLLLEGRYPEPGEGNDGPQNTMLNSGAFAAQGVAGACRRGRKIGKIRHYRYYICKKSRSFSTS
jgi:hypothetical protein